LILQDSSSSSSSQWVIKQEQGLVAAVALQA
jgi:hypothetical protein